MDNGLLSIIWSENVLADTLMVLDRAVVARNFTPDTTNPTLHSFSLNLTSEVLVLTVDETFSSLETNPTLLTLQSGENSTSVTLTVSSTASPNDSTEVVISLISTGLSLTPVLPQNLVTPN